jgi:XTP/dITP diphosphohydrolase
MENPMSQRQLLFATANKNKTREVRQILGAEIEILDLNDIQLEQELEENENTLEGNALSKARQALSFTGIAACLAEDTGLEVKALNDAPGVHSARYAGIKRSDSQNIRKLLEEMEGQSDRTARFRTVIAYLDGEGEFLFEGIVNGKIAHQPQGKGGFGYDPVFIPDGYEQSFGLLSAEIKNSISHRGRAFQSFYTWYKAHH